MLQFSYLLIQNKDSILRNKSLFEILIEFQDFELLKRQQPKRTCQNNQKFAIDQSDTSDFSSDENINEYSFSYRSE